jgi:hypothetical protein
LHQKLAAGIKIAVDYLKWRLLPLDEGSNECRSVGSALGRAQIFGALPSIHRWGQEYGPAIPLAD